MGCLENLNYEILAKNCSFKETRDIVKQMCKERYEIPPGFKIVEKAVRGMLPKGKLGDDMYRRLFVYVGPDHKQAAQKPEVWEVK